MTGYFLEGAVYELAFAAGDFAARLDATWRAAGGESPVDVVCGFYENQDGHYHNSALYATVTAGGTAEVVHVHRKMFLATYGVFDEERFLSRGRHLDVFSTPFGPAAMLICEDAWHSIMPTIAALKGARLIIVPSASPGRGIGGNGMLESVERWRDTAAAHRERARRLRALCGARRVRGRQRDDGLVVHRLAARRDPRIARRAHGRRRCAYRARSGRSRPRARDVAAALGRSRGGAPRFAGTTRRCRCRGRWGADVPGR